MPSSLSAAIVAAKNPLGNGLWAWLLEVQLDAAAGYHLTTYSQPIAYGSKTWSPFPFSIAPVESTTSGDLPSFECEISNVSKEFANAIENGQILGHSVQVHLVYIGGSVDVAWSGRFLVSSARVNVTNARMTLDLPNLLDATAPAQRYLRTRCRKAYGQSLCGFVVNRPYATPAEYPDFDATTCDFGLDTPNGCRAHGAAELASGYDVNHPQRFGGCPGIPKAPVRL